MRDVFVFTEAYNCGKIAKIAIQSFLEHHPGHKVNVFGKDSDFKDIGIKSGYINYISLENDEKLKELYKNGHAGTSHIHANVLLKTYGDYDRIIHFDSDVLFREECVSDIIKAWEKGFSLIGQRRNYEKNRGGLKYINGMSVTGIKDTVGTCFFGMDLKDLKIKDPEIVRKMCQGAISLTGEPILDYFDPVSFHVMHNGGRIKYLSSLDYGGGDENGSWDNGFNDLNLLCDFGKKFVHFAGVGSGLNFTNNGSGNVPTSYSEWAKDRYNLYSILFYGETQGKYNTDAYKKMKSELDL